MTIAEQLQAMGAEKARAEALEMVAVRLLEENADLRFIERITELELSTILKLQAELETKD